ncbi:MAG: hypothetical protein ACP5RT_01890 [Candidatus Micrarchaeia archaeon]
MQKVDIFFLFIFVGLLISAVYEMSSVSAYGNGIYFSKPTTSIYSNSSLPMGILNKFAATDSGTCSCNPVQCFCSYSHQEITEYPTLSCSLNEKQNGNYSHSPTIQVNESNSASAMWLLTAPTQPSQIYADDELFYPYSKYIAGDACLSNKTSLLSNIELKLEIYFGDGSFTPSISYNINNIGTMTINNYGYSPMVDNSISNGFSTRSYIFDQVPSYIQHGLWSWEANFANLQPFTESNTIYPSYKLTNSCKEGSNSYTYNCYYSCIDTFTVDSGLSNYNIPFTEVVPSDGLHTFDTPVLPYILYNYSIPSQGSLLFSNYMNMSYDIFGPWNYYSPKSRISPFPINTGSRFFVNYNGILENARNPISLPSSISSTGQANQNNMWNGITHMPGFLSQKISNPISIAVAPNNYIYVLNYSNQTKNYYISIMRLVPKGYYNTTNYQPDSVANAKTENDWYNNWNNYWKNVIMLQNSSVYVVRSINLDTFNNSFLYGFMPINISVDNFGDVFITGEKNSQPALAEITNTTLNNKLEEAYNSITTNGAMQEITVSPTGSLIFLASQSSGFVYIYSSANFSQINEINLTYHYMGQGLPPAPFNPISFFGNGDMYNQTYVLEYLSNDFFEGQPVADSSLHHHPLGIADINGYLYVLDNFNGDTELGYNKYYSHPYGGIFYNVLLLRVFNSTGSEVPFIDDNTYHVNDVSNPNTQEYSYPTYSAAYPPYGWIISANITGVELSSLGSQEFTTETGNLAINGVTYNNVYQEESFTFCGSDFCTFNPYNLNPANHRQLTSVTIIKTDNTQEHIYMPISYYNGTYYPIGPELLAISTVPPGSSTTFKGTLTDFGETSTDFKDGLGFAAPFTNIGFSVNFNNTINILFPDPNPANPYTDLAGSPIYNPNMFKELLITKINIENYTNLFGGFPRYYCYSNSTQPEPICNFQSSVGYMYPPVYTDTNPFKYLENLGSPEVMPIENIIYSSFSGNAPGSSAYCGNTLYNLENGEACGNIKPNAIAINSTSLINNANFYYAFNPFASAQILNSQLNGYTLVPYEAPTTITQQIACSVTDGAKTEGAQCDNGCPAYPTYLSNTITIYSYGIINASSNNFNSIIEGGDTYLRYSNGGYYIPNLSDEGLILTKNMLLNVLTDRNFTNIYVNVTNPNGLGQTVVNASKTSNFQINTYTQGKYPAFSTISSLPEANVIYGTNAVDQILKNTEATTGGIFGSALSGIYTGMYYFSNPVPEAINLFDWYKINLFTDYLDLYLNQSPLGPVLPWYNFGNEKLPFYDVGYTRIIYVMNDKFNNTIYTPIDADIANITTIKLNINPVVDPNNANQTTLYITGNATYFDGIKYIPLADNSIYIYFNNNINYFGHNPLQNPQQAIECAYANMGKCVLANPAFTSFSSGADVITYSPQYNSLGVCNPPPTKLFQSPVYNCNIYGNDNLPEACQSIYANGRDITQWCIPYFKNGTGICTSQIGLMGVATTSQDGSFSLTANACGIGSATISAIYYGYPYNEPVTVTQPYLPNSAQLYEDYPQVLLQKGQMLNPPNLATFQVVNFTWTPNETIVSPVTLGLAELSYGNIDIIEITGTVLLLALILYILRSKQ